MKARKSIVWALLCLVFLNACTASADIFMVPQGLKALESEALDGIPLSDGIVLPESLDYIAPDAFESTVIYGVSGGKAEAYAKSRNLEFRPIDIANIAIDVPPYASPYRPFTVRAEAESLLPYETQFRVYKDGRLCWEGEPSQDGTNEIILYEAGLYDYEVTLKNAYTDAQAYFEGETEIYEPVRLSSDRWFVRVGESFRPIDETEERSVTLTSDGEGLSIAGDTITALALGKYIVTAVCMQDGDPVYTDFEVNVVVPAERILIDEADISLYLGESIAPMITVEPAESAQTCEFTFESSDPFVAAADENGVITAFGQGSCVITVKTFDAAAAINVRVLVAAEDIRLDEPESTVITEGSLLRLNYTMLPESTDDTEVLWSSSDEGILSVDAAGYVHARSAGSARVRAVCAANTAIYAEMPITVVPGTRALGADVPSWLYVGEEAALNITAEPESALEGLSVSVSDESVLSINENNVLTPLKAGQATVTLTSADWYSVSYPVTVYERCREISAHIGELYLNEGMSAKMSDLLSFAPAGCRMEEITYLSSAPALVQVDADGVITALQAGEALVTAQMGDVSFTLPVHVVTDGKVISSASVSSSYLTLVCGQTSVITPTLGGASSKYNRGQWYSDAPDIVSIEGIAAGGKVTVKAQRPGTAHVYMLSSSGISAACEVLVNPVALKNIRVKTAGYTLNPGESTHFDYALEPANADTSGLYTFSSDPGVAVLSEDGTITAVGAGKCELFVFIGDLAASCRVTVSSVPMEEAWLCESEMHGFAGESATICYNFIPETASPALFRWTSDNTDVAAVDPLSGLVSFRAAGEALLQGDATDGSALTLHLKVIVDERPVKSLTLATEEIELDAGQSETILYSVYPQNASYAEAVFESADENVAKVDEYGRVHAVRSGMTDIFVTVGRGDYAITRTVSVTVRRTSDVQYRAFIMGQFTVPGSKGYLPFSLNSTRAVYDALNLSTLDAAGYSIRFMPANPTIENVRAALRGIAEQTDEDDVTVIYLLTHGSYYDSTGYFMQFANGTEYYANTILSDVEKISGHVLLVFDSCHSGRALQCSEVSRLRASGGVYQGLNGTGHLSIICGSTDTKSTYYDVNDPVRAYDFFTKAFAQGLGWNMLSDTRMNVLADADGDGCVTVRELFAFVRPQTQNLISAYVQLHGKTNFVGNPAQYPSCFIAEGEDSLVIWGR